MNKTVPISEAHAVAHECEYRAREIRTALSEWNATSDPVKRAIFGDAANTIEHAHRSLSTADRKEKALRELIEAHRGACLALDGPVWKALKIAEAALDPSKEASDT